MLTLLGEHLKNDTYIVMSIEQVIIFSRITVYIEHMMSDIHPPLGFHSIGGDAMMQPQHLTCVSEFEEVLRLPESQGSWE